MKKLLIVFFALFSSHADSIAQPCPVNTAGPTTTVFFTNGINTLQTSALLNLAEIEIAYAQVLPNQFPHSAYEFCLNYNSTDGVLADVVQVFLQRSREQSSAANSLSGYQIISHVQNSLPVSDLEILLNATIASSQAEDGEEFEMLLGSVVVDLTRNFLANVLADANEAAAQDDLEISEASIANFLRQLFSGNRVIAIAHSQGNLITNEAIREIVSRFPGFGNSISAVGIATPAITALREDFFLTAEDDAVINGLRAMGFSVLRNDFVNTPNGEDFRSDIFHLFTTDYFDERLPSRAAIDAEMERLNLILDPPEAVDFPVSVASSLIEIGGDIFFATTDVFGLQVFRLSLDDFQGVTVYNELVPDQQIQLAKDGDTLVLAIQDNTGSVRVLESNNELNNFDVIAEVTPAGCGTDCVLDRLLASQGDRAIIVSGVLSSRLANFLDTGTTINIGNNFTQHFWLNDGAVYSNTRVGVGQSSNSGFLINRTTPSGTTIAVDERTGQSFTSVRPLFVRGGGNAYEYVWEDERLPGANRFGINDTPFFGVQLCPDLDLALGMIDFPDEILDQENGEAFDVVIDDSSSQVRSLLFQWSNNASCQLNQLGEINRPSTFAPIDSVLVGNQYIQLGTNTVDGEQQPMLIVIDILSGNVTNETVLTSP